MKELSVTDKIVQELKDIDCKYQYFEHDPVRTSEEAARVRSHTGFSLKQGAKAIIVKVKEAYKGKRFVMFVLPGDKRFDSDKVESVLNFKELRFATEDEVESVTGGVLPGGVPPFGNLFGLEVFVEKSLLNNEQIIFNAGDRSISIGLSVTDYIKIVKPRLVDIV